jgi:hypothetical protein
MNQWLGLCFSSAWLLRCFSATEMNYDLTNQKRIAACIPWPACRHSRGHGVYFLHFDLVFTSLWSVLKMENNLTSTGKISVSNFKPNYNISFHNHAGEKIGTLDFNTDKLVFTGDAEESAKVFIDFIAQSFAKRLEEERQAERNKLAAWMIQFGFATGHGDTMEELVDALGTEIVDRIDGEVEAAIRARSKE